MSEGFFVEEAAKLGVALDASTERQLLGFLEALYRANEVHNLTRVPRELAMTRHLLDSLSVAPLIPLHGRVLDVGAGPGFPSVPLAIARPDLSVTALDSHENSLEFVRSLRLANLRTEWGRAESFGHRDAFDVVTGRALAPLAIQLELSAAPCVVGGFVLPMRTAAERTIIEALDPTILGLALESMREVRLPDGEGERLIPIYRKVSVTPDRFPRAWPRIKRDPIGSTSPPGRL